MLESPLPTPKIIFLYYPAGLKSSVDIRKKSAAPYMFDWVNASLKRLKRFEDEAKVEQISAIVRTHSVSFYSICFVLTISLLNLILLQYDAVCAIDLLLLLARLFMKAQNTVSISQQKMC